MRRAHGAAPGDALFPSFVPRRDGVWLGQFAASLGFARSGWHAFRRGMAADLVAAGTPLAQVLTSGGWRSTAFLRYVSRGEADAVAACDAALAASDSDADHAQS